MLHSMVYGGGMVVVVSGEEGEEGDGGLCLCG